MKKTNKFLFCLSGLILIMIFFLSGGWQIAKGQIDLALNTVKYQGALAKVNFWLTNFSEDIFNNPALKGLNKPVALPLEIGAKGSTNPFRAPLTPEELLKGAKQGL
jgi:hypothetical protein